MTRLGQAGAAFLEILFPGRCLLCGRWLLTAGANGQQLCRECVSSLVPIQGPRCDVCGTPLVSESRTCGRCQEADYSFERHRSVFAYAGGVRDLIAGLKFEHRSRLADFFADILGPRILADYPGVPLVPVPGHKPSDAVAMIARKLEARHGITVVSILRRSGGRAQKTLDLRERRENLLGRIRFVGTRVPARVVLFDDVFTTGATADTCSRVLLEAGCQGISVVSIAMEE